MAKEEKLVDIAIVGNGPAGWSCAMTARMRGLSATVIAPAETGGWLGGAERIDNYPGLPQIPGKELLERFRQQALALGAEEKNALVRQIMPSGDRFLLLAENDVLEARAVVLCMGAARPVLLPGEEELLGGGVSYMMVSEAGASVYSASKLAAEEFPEYDVNLRSAVSIARRMQDPLAELVKIDPKAIGVGQYQHDMPQKRLDETLGGVVEDCVNAVGVDVNTASASLLGRVAGLNGTTAKNIVKYREENGAFTTRRQLLKVPKVGPKAFQQCAGFLRVPESRNVLDHTGVHPESYPAAEQLLTLCGYTAADVGAAAMSQLPQKVRAMGEENAARQIGVGVPTLQDVVQELVKPGRDVRDDLPAPILRTDVLDIKDLKPGMELTGTVRNVVDFGVFVDIGVHQDGLVHISQICDRFIKHPSQAVAVGDVVKVVVLEVDEKKHRISLSMRQAAGKK